MPKGRKNDGTPYRLTDEEKLRRGRLLAAVRDSRRAEDPEADEAFRVARVISGTRGMETLQRRLRTEPDLRERTRAARSEVGQVNIESLNGMRRKCVDCGRIMAPGNMGMHLKHSGHAGYEELVGPGPGRLTVTTSTAPPSERPGR